MMTPKAAFEKQVECYRAMKPEQRVDVALRLHELACEMARLGIRRQYPQAEEAELNRLLHERLRLARSS